MRQQQISIITVCFNSEKTIERSFKSVLNQTSRQLEYIVIDGKSTDATIDIIKQYDEIFEKTEIDFFYISEPDTGIYEAMNKGIRKSKGSLIGILNSDDYFENDVVEFIKNALSENPDIGIFYGYIRTLIDSKEFMIYRYNYDNYLTNLKTGYYAAAQHPTCFINRAVYETIGLYDTQFKLAADYDFLIRAKKNNINFMALDKIITNFSLSGVSVSTPEHIRFKERYEVLYKNYLITKDEYDKEIKKLHYSRIKEIKKKIYKQLFH